MNATLTPAAQDTLATAIYQRMRADVRAEVLQELTPRERRHVAKALTRQQLRRRAGKTWSTERVTHLTVGDDRVAIYPCDHGGWTICSTIDETLILATSGRWEQCGPTGDIYDEQRWVWADQAAAVEALAATI